MSAVRRVIGVEHITSAQARGFNFIEVRPDDIITDLAKESAVATGIELRTGPHAPTVVPRADGATSMQRQLFRRSPKWRAPKQDLSRQASRIDKLAIVGVGGVGTNIAQLSASDDIAREIVLIDVVPGVAEATALDLTHASGISGSKSRITGGQDLAMVEDASVVVVTAGKPRTTGMTRNDLITINQRVIESVAEAIRNLAPDAIIIVVTNPLDEMTLAMLRATGFPRTRILGMAGTLDSSRFRVAIADAAQCDAIDVRAFTLGSHGDEMVPIISAAEIKGVPIARVLSDEAISDCVNAAVHGGGAVVSLRKTGSASIAPAYAVTEVLNHLRGARAGWIPVSVMLAGEYGMHDVVMGVPAQLDMQGLTSIVEVPMTEQEKSDLYRAFDTSKGNQAQIQG